MRQIDNITTTGSRGSELPDELFDGNAYEIDASDAKVWNYASLKGVRARFRKQAKAMDGVTVKTRLIGDGDAAVLQVQACKVAQPRADAAPRRSGRAAAPTA